MATSGSFQTSGYSDSAGSPDYCIFSWSVSSQSIEGNYSVISWSLTVGGGTNSYWYNTIKERYVTVNDYTQTSADKTTVYNGTVLFSGSTTIYHNADGNKSFSASAGAAFEWYGAYNSKGSGSWSLPQIPRATTPTLSATSVTMGNSVTITLSPVSSGFKHKLRYQFITPGGAAAAFRTEGLSVGNGFTASGNTTVTFTPPTSIADYIPNDPGGTCNIHCTTYNASGTQIGEETIKTITLNVPSYSLTGSIALTGNNLRGTAYVQGKSTVTGKITAASSYGATIKSYSSTVDGKTYSGQTFTSDVLSSGSKSASVTIVDTRGKTYTFNSASFTVYEYSPPYITSFSVERQSDGTTVKATLKGGITALNNQNTKSFTVTLNGVTNTITSSAYTIDATTTFTNVPTDSTLTATAKIKDYYTDISKDTVLPTVAVTLDFLANGKGIAMGKVAETTDLLDVAWNTKVGKNLTVGGTLTVAGKTLLNLIYPVGSIYMSVNSTSPATLFGGTWEQIKNRFLIGCGDTYAAGATGGAATHTLTENEMPSHKGHLYDNYDDNNAYTDRGGDTNSYYLSSSASGYSKYENRMYKVASGNEMVIQGYSRGGGAAHNNMPPYLAIYMWKRTS